MVTSPATNARPKHGYPHLPIIKESIKLLYKKLSRQRLDSFAGTLDPKELVPPSGTDIIIGVQSLAGIIARHLQLPKGCIIVNFREMDNPGRVELTPEDEYLVDLHPKYRDDYRDIAAVLAHEITHVFLHRHGIWWPDTSDDEILTDTTAVYLGVGSLCLNAYRVTEHRQEAYVSPNMREIRVTTTEEALGYLTPEEFGYVLGKRSLAFGEKADGLITSPAAQAAFNDGYWVAVADQKSAPLAGCSWWQRWAYCRKRRYISNTHRKSGLSGVSCSFGGYQFEVTDSMRVIFECPVCSQRLRLPTGKGLNARCSVCETALHCQT